MSNTFDPVCLIHGKKASEHECLYCCLCFKPLAIEQCLLLPNGKREDVCIDCHHKETEVIKHRMLRYKSALEKIRDIDYRGNRSTESTIAFEALRQ